MFKKILLSIDGSEHSMRAADKAIELGKLDRGEIELLYVIDGSKSKSDILHFGDSDSASHKRKKMLLPYKEAIEEAGLNVEVTMLHGKNGIAEAIIEHANANHFDVIVLGSRGLNTMQTMILGSVSHKVMKHVHAPVLLVK